ncbi:CHY zinc finger protein [Alicyclobacillus fastidiosus]|uniref:CHY zinc finger protein n=1 Tax=Alicyclobacillus fastidiosus TaxID=392011 RepID=A0ABV5AEZ8_9BACL|nr:CHY zinc finger protein [Alicyclobacillus fastidiosus]WEH09464.1 CHY zinc finger protein [Alicyclobacillus fastidiosus]
MQRHEKLIYGVLVRGIDVLPDTKCGHYASEKDIIAIKFPCCNTYYPCYECHEAVADHEAIVWPRQQFGEQAVLCGHCGSELTIQAYLDADSTCPHCQSAFNPGCKAHYPLYFAMD